MSTPQAAKRGRPTSAERAARSTRILDAAVACIAAEGLAGSSLDSIASAAGVTKRTIYRDHGDKAAVFAAAVDREHERLRSAATAESSLLDVATELVFVLHGDTAIALHGAMLGEAPRQPDLAQRFWTLGPAHSIDLLASRLPASASAFAADLYSLLLGEPHRRRLLGLEPAPNREEARSHAERCLALLGLTAHGDA